MSSIFSLDTWENWLGITWLQEQAIGDLPNQFPAAFEQAKIDLGKLKAGLKAGLFSVGDKKQALDWFKDFPDLWETIRPNWTEPDPQTGMISAHKQAFANEVDAWVGSLPGEVQQATQLGLPPVIIAGIIIAGAAGVVGALWAVGYIKEQANISKMIDATVAGKLPAEVLQAAIEKEQNGGPLADITDLLKWGAVAAAVWFLAPVVKDLFGGRARG